MISYYPLSYSSIVKIIDKKECLLYYGIILKRSQKGGAYKIETNYL